MSRPTSSLKARSSKARRFVVTVSHARGVYVRSRVVQRDRHEEGTAAHVSGLRLHSLWGPRACVRARIDDEDWVIDPRRVRTGVRKGSRVWTLPVCREERATPWTAHRTRGPQRPHALSIAELDSGPQHRRLSFACAPSANRLASQPAQSKLVGRSRKNAPRHVRIVLLRGPRPFVELRVGPATSKTLVNTTRIRPFFLQRSQLKMSPLCAL
jgi:hypothetical protein